MPESKLPNVPGGLGKTRFASIQNKSNVSLTTGVIPQDEIELPNYGDVVMLSVELTASATGTLTTPADLAAIISTLNLKDRQGKPILSAIVGSDLQELERYFNIGRSRTMPTFTNSNQSYSFMLPFVIKQADMPVKIQLSLAPYSAAAASGATGGTVSFEIVAWYKDKSRVPATVRVANQALAIASGNNTYAPYLLKDVTIHSLLFKVGTESNITDLTFSSDGNAELQQISVADLTVLDNDRLVSGHVTGQFSLYNSPFQWVNRTIFNLTGAGSDTLTLYTVHSFNAPAQ